ncbi:MAG: signal peptidase II [Eubacterium sp.]|nr:signal peptidase II [Eubacterium sp.]
MKLKRTVLWIQFFTFILVFTFIDQFTKYLASSRLKVSGKEIKVIPKVLSFYYLNGGNRGAAWGLFSGKTSFLILFTVVILMILFHFVWNIYRKIEFNYSLKLTKLIILQYLIGLIIAGAVGNIIDRVRYGAVIDFIRFTFINFPIFNVADIYVTVSCFLIVIICLFFISEDEFNEIFSFRKKKGSVHDGK